MRTRPWIRFWARSLDYALWGFVYGIVVAVFWPDNVFLTNPLIASVLITGSWILPEAMLMAIAGSTPGKALLNVKVSFEGTAAEVDDAWIERGLRVWALGLGIGLPVVSWVAAAISHRDLTATGITSWDRKCRFAVQHGHVGWAVGIVTAILIVAPFALAVALKNTGSAYTKFQPGTSAATLPQVGPQVGSNTQERDASLDYFKSIAPKPDDKKPTIGQSLYDANAPAQPPGEKARTIGQALYDTYAPKQPPGKPDDKQPTVGQALYDANAPKPGAKLGSNTQERDALPDNIPIGLARNNDEQEFGYAWELLKDPKFKSAHQAALGPKVKEHWLAELDGPSAPTQKLKVDGTEYVFASTCKAHDCVDNNTVLLYSAAQGVVYEKIFERGTTTLIGAPPPAVVAVLDRLSVAKSESKESKGPGSNSFRLEISDPSPFSRVMPLTQPEPPSQGR